MKTNFSEKNIWLNIDKPIGISSARVVAIVKRYTKAKKVGHGGTLDVMACGVLPVALNKATKTTNDIMQSAKKYSFFVKWGAFTDTDDSEGKVIEVCEKRPLVSEIIAILPDFVGKIMQKPSKFSALKINGKRAYDLARSGVDFEINERMIEIFSLKLIKNTFEGATFEARCSKGTYVRSLARDIALKLGCCGYVGSLERLEVGQFTKENKISLEKLKNMIIIDGS